MLYIIVFFTLVLIFTSYAFKKNEQERVHSYSYNKRIIDFYVAIAKTQKKPVTSNIIESLLVQIEDYKHKKIDLDMLQEQLLEVYQTNKLLSQEIEDSIDSYFRGFISLAPLSVKIMESYINNLPKNLKSTIEIYHEEMISLDALVEQINKSSIDAKAKILLIDFFYSNKFF